MISQFIVFSVKLYLRTTGNYSSASERRQVLQVKLYLISSIIIIAFYFEIGNTNIRKFTKITKYRKFD